MYACILKEDARNPLKYLYIVVEEMLNQRYNTGQADENDNLLLVVVSVRCLLASQLLLCYFRNRLGESSELIHILTPF